MKDLIQTTCPKCGHQQQEPAQVVSFYCKGCRSHLDIQRDGVQRTKIPRERSIHLEKGLQGIQSLLGKWKGRFSGTMTSVRGAQPPAPEVPESPVAPLPPQELLSPKSEEPSEANSGFPPPPIASRDTALPTRRPDDLGLDPPAYSPKQRQKPQNEARLPDSDPSPARRRLRNERTVTCFECGEDFSAPRIGPAPACPECDHQALSCDLVIETATDGDQLTYGNVRILKRGSVNGGRIACHNFAAYGRFSGTVECTGRVEINFSGTLDAAITCRELVIPRRTDVKITGPVIADSIEVEGRIDAHALIHQDLNIPAGGEFQGKVTTRTVNVDDDALLAADLQIHSNPKELRDEFIRSTAS
ncbi:polymer-forming cytoskeletal protein [Sulfuriroseicoccus oceanibius]|uniref:Polymer-forming cytoskeletal protein n=1 Tax=Sulfuriroseicoccus oceanibius TaxID=2707525 RepID=A0A6B3L8B3_9BACT|nr:polymer-forming cytoskeletal protein [Sulfuriroseicoccus oceanibius]QQL45973.1 polymer-forming cytoskeletal protein [Sulfuriroseicoccus oceanibius]